MNARSEIIHLNVLGGQVQEAVNSVFHNILFFRSTGKYKYKDESSYSIETLGAVDVMCDFIDFTYVRADSDELDQHLKREAEKFVTPLRFGESPQTGEITLTFYQKKQKRWPFSTDCIPWEIWTLQLQVIHLPNESERNAYRTDLGLMVEEKIMHIAEIMNREQYVPRNPNRGEIDSVFDTSFSNVQPYLFKISHEMEPPSLNVGLTMRRFLKDTLML